MIALAIPAGLLALWKTCTALAALAERLEAGMHLPDYE